MGSEADRAMRALEDAARFAETFRFEMSEDYLALIDAVESLPQNQSGADKSGRWRGSTAGASSRVAHVHPVVPKR